MPEKGEVGPGEAERQAEGEPQLLFERYPEEEQIIDLFENGQIVKVENIDDALSQIRHHSNDVYLAQMDHRSVGFRVVFAGQEAEGIFKPLSGEDLEDEKRRWVIDDFYHREVAAYLIDRAIGFGLMPPTVIREVEIEGKKEIGSLRLYIPPQEADVWYSNDFYGDDPGRFTQTPDWQAIAALDYLIAEGDRHPENLLFSKAEPCQIYPIDSGLSLVHGLIESHEVTHSGPRANLAFKKKGKGVFEAQEREMPEEIRERINAFHQDKERKAELTRQLREIKLPERDIKGFLERVEKMATTGRFL